MMTKEERIQRREFKVLNDHKRECNDYFYEGYKRYFFKERKTIKLVILYKCKNSVEIYLS